jgi:hypothetical protein
MLAISLADPGIAASKLISRLQSSFAKSTSELLLHHRLLHHRQRRGRWLPTQLLKVRHDLHHWSHDHSDVLTLGNTRQSRLRRQVRPSSRGETTEDAIFPDHRRLLWGLFSNGLNSSLRRHLDDYIIIITVDDSSSRLHPQRN